MPRTRSSYQGPKSFQGLHAATPDPCPTPNLAGAVGGSDQELETWLQVTGYYDEAKRKAVLAACGELIKFNQDADRRLAVLQREKAGEEAKMEKTRALLMGRIGLEASKGLPTPTQKPTSLKRGSDDTSPGERVSKAPRLCFIGGPASTGDGPGSLRSSTAPPTEQRVLSNTMSPPSFPIRPAIETPKRPSIPMANTPKPLAPVGSQGAVASIAQRFQCPPNTRFFVASAAKPRVTESMKDGLWIAKEGLSKKLARAFVQSPCVILFFSCSPGMTVHGYVRMTTPPRADVPYPAWVWCVRTTPSSPFRVEWLRTLRQPYAVSERFKVGDGHFLKEGGYELGYMKGGDLVKILDQRPAYEDSR